MQELRRGDMHLMAVGELCTGLDLDTKTFEVRRTKNGKIRVTTKKTKVEGANNAESKSR